MIKKLKLVAILEGISYLILLFITWPVKLVFGIKEPNLIVGMSHGVLFILYVVLVLKVHSELKWSYEKTLLALFLSVVPFGTFWAERKLFVENK